MIRELIFGTASVLALGIGAAALDFSANADEVPNMASAPSHHWLNAKNLSKDDIRWAQVRLRIAGFYNGSLDGVVGSETKRAILRFQKSNDLLRTAMLDQQTANVLMGDTAIGQGSSTAPKGPMTNSSGTSDFSGHAGQ